MRSTSVNYC